LDLSLYSGEPLAFLRELQKHDARYMIVGMAGAALQGAGLVTVDIDLWVEDLFDPGFRRAVEAVGGTYIPPVNLFPPRLGNPPLDTFDLVMHMSGLGRFADEYRYVRWIRIEQIEVPVLAVERIIVSKRVANRDKDRAVLPILEELARTLRALEELGPDTQERDDA